MTNKWQLLHISAAIVFIALAMHLPVSLFATAGHDDALFIGYGLGAAGNINKVRLFLGNPKSMPSAEEGIFQLTSWYHSESNDWLALECSSNDQPMISNVTRMASPDIAAYFKDETANPQTFSLVVRKSDDCRVSLESQNIPALPIAVLMANESPRTSLGDGVMNVDERFSDETAFKTPLAVKRKLGSLYRWITPPIAGAGFLCYLACLSFSLMRRRAPGGLFWIASMLWLTYLSRIVLLTSVDVSSFPAANYLYLAPAPPILYAAAMASFSSIFAGPMSRPAVIPQMLDGVLAQASR